MDNNLLYLSYWYSFENCEDTIIQIKTSWKRIRFWLDNNLLYLSYWYPFEKWIIKSRFDSESNSYLTGQLSSVFKIIGLRLKNVKKQSYSLELSQSRIRLLKKLNWKTQIDKFKTKIKKIWSNNLKTKKRIKIKLMTIKILIRI